MKTIRSLAPSLCVALLAAYAGAACRAQPVAATPASAAIAAGRPVARAAGDANLVAPAKQCPSNADIAAVRVDRPVTHLAPPAGDEVQADPRTASRDRGAAAPLVALRQEIAVHVAGLATLLAREECSGTHRKIVLFLDGRPVPTATPYPPTDPSSETLKFVLDRREPAREEWTHLLGKPTFADRQVPVSVGIEDEFAVASDQFIRLRVIPRAWFWVWSVLLVVLAGAFIALASRSDVLREPGFPPADASRKPYSLAKTQAAWWFFLILASYLFIGLVTGDYGTSITGTVLTLMGISAATAIGSATIDAGRPVAIPAMADATPGDSATVAAIAASLAPRKASRWWWLDILSDEHGVNFHRFQMAVWTAVLGIIFIHDVYVGLAMPQFDNSLLGLLGISAGTYLGLKTTSEARS
jgi:hypothetical protein